MTTTITFQIGQKYSARSLADSSTTYTWLVTNRTGKFITVQTKFGDIARVAVRVHDGVERAKPFGTYASSPTIAADRPNDC